MKEKQLKSFWEIKIGDVLKYSAGKLITVLKIKAILQINSEGIVIDGEHISGHYYTGSKDRFIFDRIYLNSNDLVFIKNKQYFRTINFNYLKEK